MISFIRGCHWGRAEWVGELGPTREVSSELKAREEGFAACPKEAQGPCAELAGVGRQGEQPLSPLPSLGGGGGYLSPWRGLHGARHRGRGRGASRVGALMSELSPRVGQPVKCFRSSPLSELKRKR